MWLRLLMQLGDLLPHLSRLVPMMERVVSSHRALPPGSDAPASPLQDGVDSLQESHRRMLRQLSDQSSQLASIEGEIEMLRQSAAAAEERSTGLERRLGKLQTWLSAVSVAALILMSAALVLLARLSVQIHAH